MADKDLDYEYLQWPRESAPGTPIPPPLDPVYPAEWVTTASFIETTHQIDKLRAAAIARGKVPVDALRLHMALRAPGYRPAGSLSARWVRRKGRR